MNNFILVNLGEKSVKNYYDIWFNSHYLDYNDFIG